MLISLATSVSFAINVYGLEHVYSKAKPYKDDSEIQLLQLPQPEDAV